MIDVRLETLIKVAELKNFTKAAEELNLTQPCVSHHISSLEEELNITIFNRQKNNLFLTNEGEIVLKYAKRFQNLSTNLNQELIDYKSNITKLRIGLTHTSESNIMTEVLAKCVNIMSNLTITINTDTIKNLYDKLENYEIDIAIIEGKNSNNNLNSFMLDTDYLVCAMSNNDPLSKNGVITLNELKKEKLILRLPTSATRILFESTLESINESIDEFNIILEVDNIATIKDLVRKNLGISILPKSACMNEVKKKKMTILPIENLSMIRETNIIYPKNFSHIDILKTITKIYQETLKEERN
ncbi:transcriptional regulator LysR family [Firmicutes bacterium CAG:449]|nr:transcriptional regulator LysR family [Firmicutes bacterium CAG:449]